jgi:hypothetical protein
MPVFNKDLQSVVAFRPAIAAGTYADSAQYSTIYDITEYGHATFIVNAASSMGGNVVCAIEENSSSSSSGTTASTDRDGDAITGTLTAGTDDGRVGVLSIHSSDLGSGNRYVMLKVTPASADEPLAASVLLGGRYALPTANGTANEVAFAVGNND